MTTDAPRDPSRDLWEDHADWWIDGFTDGADPEYEEQILPLAAAELGDAQTILDIGCGDGQISRMMASVGATVVGIDPTWNQIKVAHERGGGAHYARSTADELPFPDATFDATVACLVFEHIDAVDAAIAEVARVTKPGGRFCFFLNHPLLQTCRDRAGSTITSSTRPSSTGGSGRTWSRASRSSRSSSACGSGSSTVPLAVPEHPHRARSGARTNARTGPAAGLPRASPGVHRLPPCRACCTCASAAPDRPTWPVRPGYPRTLVGGRRRAHAPASVAIGRGRQQGGS
ncbi:MAG: class I SAM-dependent methyltransferase [Ilumatobacteraceae bacterium]